MNAVPMHFSPTTQNEFIVVLVIWDIIWRGLALWHSARKNQLFWFLPLLVINSIGILPIIYLLYLKYFYHPKKTIPPDS